MFRTPRSPGPMAPPNAGLGLTGMVSAVVAGALGVGLLIPGGGTFATWSDVETVGQDTITTGRLALESHGGSWAATNSVSNKSKDDIDLGRYRIVPGDILTYRDQITVVAEGETMSATLTSNVDALLEESGAQWLEVDGQALIDGEPLDGDGVPITAQEDGRLLDVTLTVTFPHARGPGHSWGPEFQGVSAELDGITFALTQNMTGQDVDAQDE